MMILKDYLASHPEELDEFRHNVKLLLGLVEELGKPLDEIDGDQYSGLPIEDDIDFLATMIAVGGRRLLEIVNRAQQGMLKERMDELENAVHSTGEAARDAIKEGAELLRMAERLGVEERISQDRVLSDVKREFAVKAAKREKRARNRAEDPLKAGMMTGFPTRKRR